MAVSIGWTTIDGVFTLNGTITFSAAGAMQATSISTTGNGLAITGAGSIFLGNNKVINTAAPTVSSGFGSAPAPSITSGSGNFGFILNVGGGGVATSGVLTMPFTALNGWIVFAENFTANAANRADRYTAQIASTTTTVTLQSQIVSTGAATAWGAQDILYCTAVPY